MTCQRCARPLSEKNAARRKGGCCQRCAITLLGIQQQGPFPHFMGATLAKRRAGLRRIGTILKILEGAR
jgi:hypothetical protein